MNVCAVYTGLARTYKYCLYNHRNSFWKKYGITDCYAHFWHNEGEIDNHFAPWNEPNKTNVSSSASEIIEAFKAKRIALEKDDSPKIENRLNYINGVGYDFDKLNKQEILRQCLIPVKSNATSIRNAFNLVKDTNYDYYVLARPDMLWSEDLSDWPELNGKDNYYYWDTLWILKKDMFEKFANKLYNIEEYAKELLTNNPDREAKDYNFITSEAINDLHFKKIGVDLGGFIPIKMRKQIHRGNYIKN